MRKDLPPDEIEDLDELEVVARLRLSIARLARRLRQEAGTGLSPSQHSALISVAMHGPLTLGRLARIEQVSPPTITRIVVKLEDDGLLVRAVDPNDRRVTHVQITGEGDRRLDHGRSRRNAWLAQRLRTFEPEQRRRLVAALDALEALAAADEPIDDPAGTGTSADTTSATPSATPSATTTTSEASPTTTTTPTR
jgi:DNA-binding MarR family transcriptional regulator